MKHRAFAFMLASLTAAPAVALDGYVAELGYGERVHAARLGMIRQWDKQWLTEGHWHLTGYWEATVAVLSSDRAGGRNLGNLAVAPVLRFRPNASGGAQPYWDIALGLHLLTGTRIDDKHHLGGALQIGPQVGVGITFGEKSQYDLGYRFQHLTSAGFTDDGDDLNLHQVRLTYLY